jgi:hypothetical protein
MAIKDWNEDWRIPVLNQEMPADTEAEAGQEQTPAEEIMVPKKPRTGQTQVQQKKGLCPRKAPRRGRRTTPRHHRNRRNRLRQHREPHQVLLSRSKAKPRGQSYKWGVHARNLRCTEHHQNTRSRRMTWTS